MLTPGLIEVYLLALGRSLRIGLQIHQRLAHKVHCTYAISLFADVLYDDILLMATVGSH